MDKVKIAKAIDSLRGLTPDQSIEVLKNNLELSNDERNIVFTLGTYQSFILQDGDLPKAIEEYRQQKLGHLRGSLCEDLEEVSYILKAYMSPQYRKFIKHLMLSFILKKDQLYPIQGTNTDTCGICHKKLYETDVWKEICDRNPSFGEQSRKEYLSIGSPDSSATICINCMVQLQAAYELLDYLDPQFLYKLR